MTTCASASSWAVHIEEDDPEPEVEPELVEEKHSSNLFNPNKYVETITTGDELRERITDEKEKILIVLWYRNEYGHWYLNRNNHEVRGTLMNILFENHPIAEYHEIDMSEYNTNAGSYEELAEELGIDLKMLYDAPIALVVFNETGDAFFTDKGSLALVKTVDKYLHKTEHREFGYTNDLCNVEGGIRDINDFKVPSVLELEEQHKRLHEQQIEENSEKKNKTPKSKSPIKPPKKPKTTSSNNEGVVRTKLKEPVPSPSSSPNKGIGTQNLDR